MNKYTIIAIIIVVAGMYWVYSSTTTSDNEQTEQTEQIDQVSSVISVSEENYDFGDIDIFAGTVSTDYTVHNDGPADVTIIAAETSCMCTEGKIGDLTFGMHGSSGNTVVIPSGESKILTATFDPLAHGPEGTGKIKREMYLRTNSMETPEILVTFSGNVIEK